MEKDTVVSETKHAIEGLDTVGFNSNFARTRARFGYFSMCALHM